jgi:mutator protein MutT
VIEVVSALIVQDGRLLLTQRTRSDQDYPFRWETPGGKVEAGETHAEALVRELREELGSEVESIRERDIWTGEVERPGRESVRLSLYPVILAGAPRPAEGQGMGWFNQAEFIGLRRNLMPGNEKAFSQMLVHMDFMSRSAKR